MIIPEVNPPDKVVIVAYLFNEFQVSTLPLVNANVPVACVPEPADIVSVGALV